MSEGRDLAPIAVFAYNRAEHLRATLQALRLNPEATESLLYVFIDGPKNDFDRAEQEKILKVLSSEANTFFKSVSVTHGSVNRGLANSIISGVTAVISEFKKVIVLEDDLVTSRHFLRYMNDGLRIYQDEERVISIHAYVNLLKNEMTAPFFLKGADCWGWATWERGWNLFQSDGVKLLSEIREKKLENEFNFNNNVDYLKMLEFQIAGKNNSWAIRWYASAFLKSKLTLYPAQSLVKNIGFDGSGTHCEVNNDFDTDLASEPVTNFPTLIEASAAGYHAYCRFFQSIKPTLRSKITNRLKRWCKIK